MRNLDSQCCAESAGGMDYNPDVFMEQFPLVKRFVYHMIYYRVLHAVYSKNTVRSEFWTHTIDAHLLQAIISWCMVFGSDGCNQTHWKNLSQSQSTELQDSFRSGLARFTGLDSNKWTACWKEMTDFRNKYAAHRELDYISPVPILDSALAVAYFYDEWIRQVISPDTFEEPSLKETAERVTCLIIPVIDRIMPATKESQKDS